VIEPGGKYYCQTLGNNLQAAELLQFVWWLEHGLRLNLQLIQTFVLWVVLFRPALILKIFSSQPEQL
jgi:hypothetical protein